MRLLLDVMCGGLRGYLRMCGHDASYALDGEEPGSPAADDAVLARRAREERRMLVTRDVELAGREDGAVLLESRDTEGQLRELRAAGVPLDPSESPEYCGRCNGPLVRVDGGNAGSGEERGSGDGNGDADGGRTQVAPDYAPDPDEEAVWRCRDCGQWFWKGSHWERVAETLDGL